jgi:hypothetical protein
MTEKRKFFRIQQEVIFSFRAVSNDSMHQCSADQHFDHATTYGLFAQFQQLDNDSNAILQNIRQDNSEVGQYLEVLNKKINLLSQQMLAKEAVSVNDRVTGRIDLSQGGIGFTTTDPLATESWIAIKLVFIPAYTAILSYGQITRSQKLDDGSYLIGARFHQLNDEEQRVIAKQVIDTQIIQKQQSRDIKTKVHH